MEPGVTIRYYGHACFVVTDSQGRRVAIDPYDDSIGYPPLSLAADACLVSHEHFDHSNVGAVAGDPEVVRAPGTHWAGAIEVLGLVAPHHEPGKNAERGNTILFRWAMDGIALLHCGDLGAPLDGTQIGALMQVDILLVPVGGFYTIDAGAALRLAQDVRAPVVIPMHFRTPASEKRLGVLAPVEDFLKALPSDWAVTHADSNTVTITFASIHERTAPTRVIVMPYA